MSNLQVRIVTALVFGCLALWITWLGGVVFAAFSCLIGAAVIYEWTSLSHSRQTLSSQLLTWVFFVLVGATLLFGLNATWIFSVVLVGALVLALTSGRNAGWTAGGFLYASVPMIALTLLRGSEPFGFGVLIFLYAVVWGTDIAAYFNGRALGGPKLAPRFSPNKTWSGAVGGALAGVAGGCLVAYLVFTTESGNWKIPVLALVLSVVSQAGDIGESWVKRHFSVKDSGNLLPGHGGFMDRLDGLISAVTVLYIIGALVADANVPSILFNMI